MSDTPFAAAEQANQSAWQRKHTVGWNLAPTIRESTLKFFQSHTIQWHRHAGHPRSSQVCCINCLFPWSRDSGALVELFRPLVPDAIKALPLESDGQLLTFEYIGRNDYLGEAGSRKRTRGANCTSADAAVLLETGNGKVLVLIEWKYTENYGVAKTDSFGQLVARKGDHTRRKRYLNSVWDKPWNPVDKTKVPGIDALLVEPLYQLFRQQSLAAAAEVADGWDQECARAICLHLSPAGNIELHRNTCPIIGSPGDDIFALWSSLLRQPDRFMALTTNTFFAPFRRNRATDPAFQYLVERYPSVVNPQ